MCKSVGVLLLAFLAFCACRVSVAAAVEVVPLPPQVPSRTPSGALNITDVWLHNGGGRLYWNTLVTPRQIALDGARFVDPASVPELSLTPPVVKKAPVRHAKRKAKAAAAPQTVPTPAPKGVGKTSLQPPVSQGSAIPPLGSSPAAQAKPVAPAASPAKNGSSVPVPNTGALPYSSVAPAPVGDIGATSSPAGTGARSAAPAPSAFSAEDVLPRANARP